MSKFKKMNQLTNSVGPVVNDYIDDYLLKRGFVYRSDFGGCLHNGYYSKDGLYYTHVDVYYDKIEFYKEYECGGMVSQDSINIEDMDRLYLDNFISFIEYEFECFNFE